MARWDAVYERLFHLARAVARGIGWPAARLGLVHDALQHLRLLVQDLLDRLVLERDSGEGGREERQLTQRSDLLLRLGQEFDQLLRAGSIRRALRDPKSGDHRHEAAPLWAGRGGHQHEVVRAVLDGVDQPRRVVPGYPDLFGQQRLLHELVVGRLWVGGLPELLELLPHRDGLRALEPNYAG